MIERRKPWYRWWVVDLAIRAVYLTGLLHLIGLLRKHLGRKRLIILMYHRLSGGNAVSSDSEPGDSDAVPVRHFHAHMRLLRWFGEPMPLEEAWEALRDHRRGPKTLVAVTFDDGYRDNHLVGLPAWSRHGIPVTLFPAISALDGGPWLCWDEVSRIVTEADPGRDALREVWQTISQPVREGPVREDPPGERSEIIRGLAERVVRMPIEQRDRALHQLSSRLAGEPGAGRDNRAVLGRAAKPLGGRLYMTWEELRDQARAGVSIGGHTIRHPCLPAEKREVAEHEIRGCRAILEGRLGRRVTSFAYPGGFYGDREVELVRRAGYRVAVTVEKGANYPGTDPHRLRRIGLSWERSHHLALKLAFCDWIFGPASSGENRLKR